MPQQKRLMLIYLHGFHSSPLSYKASLLREYCQQQRPDIQFICPQLPVLPQAMAKCVRNLIIAHQDEYQIGLVGGSLGGYLCTWLNQEFGLKAVLINPAVRPYELFSDYLGQQTHPYTQEDYQLTPQNLSQLQALDVEKIKNPKDFWLLLQKQDEVLDYKQAAEKFAQSRIWIEEGGDHSFVGFASFIPQIIEFLELDLT